MKDKRTARIHIADRYYLQRDPYNWILVQGYMSKKHKELRYRDVGYYPNVELFSKGAANHLALEAGDTLTSLRDLIGELCRMSQAICRQVAEAA